MSSEEGMSIKALLALDGDQLIALLEQIQKTGSGISTPVNGLEEMSDNDRQELRNRLLNARQQLDTRNTSAPLDTDKLDELLVTIRDGGDCTQVTQLATQRACSTDCESIASRKTVDDVTSSWLSEEEAYDKLVKDGGRPLYPIVMLKNISENPQQYLEMLQPFWKHPGFYFEPDNLYGWEVFQRQWRQRDAFRHWQRDNRGILEEGGFERFLQERKKDLIENSRGKSVAEIEADLESLNKPGGPWEFQQATESKRRRRVRERGCNNFLEYSTALKKRLSDHGFKDKVLLLEDPTEQNLLTEWHEYLGFECWWQDEFSRESERRQKAYDDKWKYIQSRKWVASHETPEYLDSWESFNETLALVSKAQRSFGEATLNVVHARQSINLAGAGSDARSGTSETLDAALRRLAEAEEEYNNATRRKAIIWTLSAQRYSCEYAETLCNSQPALIKWVIDQIPLIKAEMKDRADDTGAASPRLAVKAAAATAEPTPVQKEPTKKTLHEAAQTKKKNSLKVEPESKKKENCSGRRRSKSAPAK